MFDDLLFEDIVFYQMYIWPLNMLFFGINASNVIIGKRRKHFYTLLVLGFTAPFLWVFYVHDLLLTRTIILIYILLYWVTLANIILGIFKSKTITFNMVLGAFCGYLLVGLIAAFSNLVLISYILDAIEGLTYFDISAVHQEHEDTFVNILYYRFITMMSIEYGDYLPLFTEAKMLSVFIGLRTVLYDGHCSVDYRKIFK